MKLRQKVQISQEDTDAVFPEGEGLNACHDTVFNILQKLLWKWFNMFNIIYSALR